MVEKGVKVRPKTLQAGKHSSSQAGFTYLIVLAAIVVLAIMAEAATLLTSRVIKADKEAELIFRGQAYRRAIESYYHAVKTIKTVKTVKTVKIYPRSLDDLLLDPRYSYRRHIRTLYADPMTKQPWTLIQAPDGGIMGVSSSSQDEPLKSNNFPKELKTFTGATQYSQWIFEFIPKETKKTDAVKSPPAEKGQGQTTQ